MRDEIEYTRKVGRNRFENSAVKSLIYGDNVAGGLKDSIGKHCARQGGQTPFATFENAEDGKYPRGFVMRKKGREGSDKVGESKKFDPEVYRQQALDNQSSKISASRKAYDGAGIFTYGAGNDLGHPIRNKLAAKPNGNTLDGEVL